LLEKIKLPKTNKTKTIKKKNFFIILSFIKIDYFLKLFSYIYFKHIKKNIKKS